MWFTELGSNKLFKGLYSWITNHLVFLHTWNKVSPSSCLDLWIKPSSDQNYGNKWLYMYTACTEFPLPLFPKQHWQPFVSCLHCVKHYCKQYIDIHLFLYIRLVLNYWYFCLQLLSSGIIGMYHDQRWISAFVLWVMILARAKEVL